jgi:signal transduction histidine kinase
VGTLRLTGPFASLRGQLAVTYAAVALLAVVVSAVLTSVALWDLVLNRIAQDLVGEAHVLADRVAGTLAEGDSAAVAAYITRIDSLTTAHITVVDRSGDRIVTTDPVPRVAREDDPDLAAALAGDTVLSAVGGLGTRPSAVRVVVPVRAPDGTVIGAIRESYNFEDLSDVVRSINVAAALGAVAAATLAAGAGLVLAVSVTRSVRRVGRAALQLAEGRSVSPLDEARGTTRELQDLIRAFNRLLGQLAVHEQARREFASDVSHELHSLASAMQTAAAALERSSDEPDLVLSRRLVAGLVGHTRRLNRLASDLLELSRWEGGQLGLELEDLDVADLVDGVIDEWAAEVERREMTLRVELSAAPMPLRGDPVRLAQALGNLLENTLKYAGSGGQILIHVQVDGARGMYAIAVEDSGPGIPTEVLPRVFERYYRVEGRAGSGPGGMGLGLAIARGIVRAHGGDLVAESPARSGARFVLRLPR